MKHLLFFSLILFSSLTGCKTYDAYLAFYDIEKPMHFGSFETEVSTDSLKLVSGVLEFEDIEDTYSENENTSITMLGGEFQTNTIDSTLLNPLFEQSNYFLGNSVLLLEIKHGIRVGAFIFGTIAASITGEDADTGTYTIKRFNQKSILYKASFDGVQDED